MHLMGRPVLAEADGVVRHDVDDARLGQRRHAHGAAHVVCEDEEGRAVRDQARRVQGDACAVVVRGICSKVSA